MTRIMVFGILFTLIGFAGVVASDDENSQNLLLNKLKIGQSVSILDGPGGYIVTTWSNEAVKHKIERIEKQELGRVKEQIKKLAPERLAEVTAETLYAEKHPKITDIALDHIVFLDGHGRQRSILKSAIIEVRDFSHQVNRN